METTQLSILVIDPDPRSRNFISVVLAQKGYNVESVSSGKEGYITILRDRPQIVIFEPALGDMNATDLLKKVRGDRRTGAPVGLPQRRRAIVARRHPRRA